jgi:spermidine/putrescine transport system substrate-binding protein
MHAPGHSRRERIATYGKPISTILAIAVAACLTACAGPSPPPAPAPPQVAEELVFYDWSGDLIETVFDEFEEEYGVQITYVAYDSPEEAVANLRAGEVYDIVVLENQYLPSLIAAGLLAQIDYRNVPNFRNISPNFRDLSYDPGNRHSIPYSWGTTGLVVRSDLVEEPVTSWTDMWDPRYVGRVVNWHAPRYTIGAALKSLGYSINSEDPQQLEAALSRLLELKPNAVWLDDEASSAPLLMSGEAVMALGWAYDVWVGQEESDDIVYVLPDEGTILWGDNFVIPANSHSRYTAELFLDFALRPGISAQIVNGNYYPMANAAADPFIDPEIRSDPVIYPTNEDLENAEILLSLSPEGEQLYAAIWERFMAAGQ